MGEKTYYRLKIPASTEISSVVPPWALSSTNNPYKRGRLKAMRMAANRTPQTSSIYLGLSFPTCPTSEEGFCLVSETLGVNCKQKGSYVISPAAWSLQNLTQLSAQPWRSSPRLLISCIPPLLLLLTVLLLELCSLAVGVYGSIFYPALCSQPVSVPFWELDHFESLYVDGGCNYKLSVCHSHLWFILAVILHKITKNVCKYKPLCWTKQMTTLCPQCYWLLMLLPNIWHKQKSKEGGRKKKKAL